jgi:dTDP-4-dehydrorhamnose 3,5-epimerase
VGGEIFDVAVDIRPESPHFGRFFSTILKAHDGQAVYIPHGFAHGFQALTDDAAILYMMTDYFAPDLAGGIRWDDPALGIDWPISDPVINARDANYPTLGEIQ